MLWLGAHEAVHSPPIAVSGSGHTGDQINSLKLSSICKSASQAVLGKMQFTLHATRRTPHGASRLVQAMSACSVKTRHAPSRQSRDARVYGQYDYGHAQKLSTPPPPPSLPDCRRDERVSHNAHRPVGPVPDAHEAVPQRTIGENRSRKRRRLRCRGLWPRPVQVTIEASGVYAACVGGERGQIGVGVGIREVNSIYAACVVGGR